ncbi:MAG: extracellular solute-binding protein [Lacrimispora sp.]|uniref:ABC transporter substrate-binding protein n=1 Tax=Lacrimispora sp. TaxID=2719234 RepID=UPI0039E5F982
MKKVLSIILLAALTGSMILTGCGKKTEETVSADKSASVEKTESTTAGTAGEEAVTITMSNWLEAEEATSGIFKELLADFMAANPNIKVESVAIPFNQYKDQVLIAGTSGNAADVIMGNSQMMVAFQGAGLLADLKGLVSQEVLDDVYPNYLAGTTFDGKVAAISWAPHPLALYYNKDLMKKAGLDPEKAPATWDEMTEMAKKIAALGKDDAGNTIYGLGLPTGKVAHTGSVANGVFYSFGGHFLGGDGKVDLNNEGNVNALKYMKQMVDEKVMPGGLEIKDLRGLFATGQIGFIIDGDMGRNAYRASSGKGEDFDASMGYAIIPIGVTGKSETVYTEHELGISASSSHQEAAAKLIEYLTGKEAMLKYHKSNAVLSGRKSVAALPEMNEDYFMEVFNKQAETASPLPATNPLFDNAMNEVTKAMERIMINNEDITTVLEETETTIKNIYGE